MKLRLALAGNPNSGKTTLFNRLTGSRQYTGNWPGVTVEKKEGILKGHEDVAVDDTPGIYSLSPYSPEEIVTGKYLDSGAPDVVINIIDATNVRRNLYLTLQLLELGIPVVLAFNMMDAVKKSGEKVDIKAIASHLGVKAVAISALTGEGVDELLRLALGEAEGKNVPPHPVFSGEVETSICQIMELMGKGSRRDAIKLFEGEAETVREYATIAARVAMIRDKAEAEADDEARAIITDERYSIIEKVTENALKAAPSRKGADTLSDKIDRVVTNRYLALPIFALVMFLVYFIAIGSVGALVTDFMNDTLFGTIIIGGVTTFLERMSVHPFLVGLIADGMLAGVGAVLGFVPQMFILFVLLSILEDIGYMSRVAFILDRIFRKFGLSGKSFIPMLVSSGCGVPGVMACRTIENERDRRLTAMTVCFIPCSAKMPIIALFAGALFGGSPLIAFFSYFLGVSSVVISGIILKKTKKYGGEPAPFVMELPPYHRPLLKNVLRTSLDRVLSFIKRATSVILLSSVILWFLQAYGVEGGHLIMIEDNDLSLLSYIGRAVAWLFRPLGFGSWQAATATFAGLIAKENVVSTFGVLYHAAEVSETGAEIWSALASDFSSLSAISFIVFNLLCAPCFAAMGAIRRELGKEAGQAICYMTLFAYLTSFLIFQLGSLLQGCGFTVLTALALLILGFVLYLLFRKPEEGKR